MAVLDVVPVERISARARAISPLKTLLALLFVVPFALGWLAAKVVGVVWIAVAWLLAAAAEGWDAGRGKRADEGGG